MKIAIKKLNQSTAAYNLHAFCQKQFHQKKEERERERDRERERETERGRDRERERNNDIFATHRIVEIFYSEGWKTEGYQIVFAFASIRVKPKKDDIA